MSTSIEDQLRRMFADDAERAPVLLDIPAVTDHAQQARERHRQQRSRHVRLGIGASILAAASVAGLSIALWGPFGDEQSSDPPNAQAPPSTPLRTPSGSTPVEPSPAGALPDPDFLRCSMFYSAEELDQVSAFAFDGTVAEIGVAPSQPAEDEAGYVGVTFEVHEWFDGGTGTTATVDMFPPDVLAFEATPPPYQTGTRLLVSGNPRSGGAPTDQAVAEGCGFTRYYDAQTAQDWRAA